MSFTKIQQSNIANNTVLPVHVSAAFEAEYAKQAFVSAIANTANTANTLAGGILKITTVNVANSTYAVLDDTAVNVGGGYLVISGAGFATGAQVLIDTTPATSTTFVNNTTLRAEVPAKTAATYNLYVVNTDGGTAIRVNGLTYSGIPTWVTGSTLANVVSNTAFTGNISATGATSYANTTALPTGFNLVTANGYYYGNISIGSTTTYSFTVEARDDELQESSRTFSLNALVSSPPTSVEYLVIAGGGAGGTGLRGGGGGAGGYRTSVPGQTSGRGSSAESTFSITGGVTYTVTVGAGGAGNAGPASATGNNGSNSVLGNSPNQITSIGGGGGGLDGGNGNSGGSGGGRGTNLGPSTPRAAGTAGQGYDGGRGLDAGGDNEGGGGGGGAGSQGGDRPSGGGGAGGSGLSSPITGSSVTRGGGGGGGSNGYPGVVPGGSGGSGGGGTGATSAGPTAGPTSASTAGSVNTGGGGGGAGWTNQPAGASGGSGIVIIRYSDTFGLAASTTGSPTVTTSGGYRIYQFTGSGSITW